MNRIICHQNYHIDLFESSGLSDPPPTQRTN